MLDERIVAIAVQKQYAQRVARLRCFRGIDYLIALALVVEVGDFRRFATAASFMAYLGLFRVRCPAGAVASRVESPSRATDT